MSANSDSIQAGTASNGSSSLWPPCVADADIIFIAALWNRAGHYIFDLWFLLSSIFLLLFSSPNLSRRRLDVYHTSTHGVALV